MTQRLFTPRALRELDSAATYIARDNHAAGESLLRAAVDAAERLALRPRLGHTDANLPSRFRIWSLTRFSYVMVYDAEAAPIRVLRILHSARDLQGVFKALPKL